MTGLFAEVLAADWSILTRLLLVGAVLLMIALILLGVPAIFDYWRRLREREEMAAVVQTKPREKILATEKPAEQTQSVKVDALGWTPDDDEDKSSETSGEIAGAQKSVLIADDDPVVVAALAQRFRRLGFQVLRSPDAMHALLGAVKVSPDLVVLDVNMPSGNGLAVCEMMASDPKYAKIPVIIHSVITDEAVKERSRRLGAHYVEKSPHSWEEIKTLVQSLMNMGGAGKEPSETSIPPQATSPERREQSAGFSVSVAAPQLGRSRVLCIEEAKDHLEHIEHQLSGLGIEATRTSDFEEGFWSCFTEKPHVLIVQSVRGGPATEKLLKRLAEHPVTRTLPVLLIDESNAVGKEQLPPASNCKILKHPVDWQELLSCLKELLPVFGSSETELAVMQSPEPAKTPEAKSPETDEPQRPSASNGESAPLTVLCIDDDPVVLRSIAIRMQPYGIKVKGADNGTAGYLMAAAERPDVILLDLKMPNGQGQYVMSKLKDNEKTSNIPVIILTVETHPGVRRQMLAAGADAFLSKPIAWHDLFEAMSHCVTLPDQLLADYQLTPSLTLAQL